MTQPLPPQEVIRRKRDGERLGSAEIGDFVAGLSNGRVVGEQAAAFLMAAYLRGLDRDETVALTRAMTESGRTLAWADLDGPVLDKHSTGGVGDNISLVLAPLLAACGAFVPMISGRGLGHSGGTLDKLDAIPGYRTQPSLEQFRSTVKTIGCAIVGQSADLAPADRVLYAIRDVTATVESIPLITASILSKKLAAGLQGLGMDVKTGSGAFMVSREDARALAHSLREVAAGAGLPTAALITDMSQPLACAAGNAVEVRHAVDVLTGADRHPRYAAVLSGLGVALLRLGGLAADDAEANRMLDRALTSGAAAERFQRMVAALGGPSDCLDRPERLGPGAPVVKRIEPSRPGFVSSIDTRAIGLAVVALGGGRSKPGDAVDPRVGFTALAETGTKVPDQPLGFVHAATEADADRAAEALRAAYRVAETEPRPTAPILDIFNAEALA